MIAMHYAEVLYERKGGALKWERVAKKAGAAKNRKPQKREPPSKAHYAAERCHLFDVPYKPKVTAYCTVPVLEFIRRYVGIKYQRRHGKQLASTLSFHLGCDIVPCVGGLSSWIAAYESKEEYEARTLRPEAGI